MMGAAHLLNVEKILLFARCFLQIDIMQAQTYDLYPLKLIQLCLLSKFRQGQYLSSAHAAQWSKDMYNVSLQMDGHGVTSQTNCETVDLSHGLKHGKLALRDVKKQTIDITPCAGWLCFVGCLFALLLI